MAGAKAKKPTAPDLPPSDSEEDNEGLNGGKWIQCKKKGKKGKKLQNKNICGGGKEACGQEVDDDYSIKCDACDEWYHPQCQNLPHGAFLAIGKFDIYWLCKTCQTMVKDKVCTEKRLEAKIAESERNIIDALKTITEARKTEHRLEEKLKAMEQEVISKISEQCANVEAVLGQQKEVVNETKKTYSEITQKGLEMKARNESDIADSVSGKLSEVMQERAEIEKRQLNVIIHGLPETSVGPEANDKEAFETFCLENLKVDGIQYKAAVRLGSKTPPENRKGPQSGQSRPWIRPLKVELSDATSKLKIIRAMPELRKTGSTIYVTPDRTPKQREEEKLLREKCKKYNSEHGNEPTEAYIKKGQMAFRDKKDKA